MKRAEAIKQIATILDRLESGGKIIQSISIRSTTITQGFAARESFAKRIELTFSEIIEGEALQIIAENAS